MTFNIRIQVSTCRVKLTGIGKLHHEGNPYFGLTPGTGIFGTPVRGGFADSRPEKPQFPHARWADCHRKRETNRVKLLYCSRNHGCGVIRLFEFPCVPSKTGKPVLICIEFEILFLTPWLNDFYV